MKELVFILQFGVAAFIAFVLGNLIRRKYPKLKKMFWKQVK